MASFTPLVVNFQTKTEGLLIKSSLNPSYFIEMLNWQLYGNKLSLTFFRYFFHVSSNFSFFHVSSNYRKFCNFLETFQLRTTETEICLVTKHSLWKRVVENIQTYPDIVAKLDFICCLVKAL